MWNSKSIFSQVIIFLTALCFFSTAEALTVIKEGDTSDDVKMVQERLIEIGYLEGEADGVFGELTRNAIIAYQTDNALDADGICGELTYKKLFPNMEIKLEPRPAPLANAGASVSVATTSGNIIGRPLKVTAVAYSPEDPHMSRYTATGSILRHGVIAVDPDVIPLGTRVYIPNYGEAVAEDIGGDIKGHIIDIAFDTHKEAINFGRQQIEIYILD